MCVPLQGKEVVDIREELTDEQLRREAAAAQQLRDAALEARLRSEEQQQQQGSPEAAAAAAAEGADKRGSHSDAASEGGAESVDSFEALMEVSSVAPLLCSAMLYVAAVLGCSAVPGVWGA